MNYAFGILIMILGVAMVIKTEWIVANFGSSSWAETHLGTSGGTRLMYKLIGIAAFFLALMGMTGMLGEVIIGTFGVLFGIK